MAMGGNPKSRKTAILGEPTPTETLWRVTFSQSNTVRGFSWKPFEKTIWENYLMVLCSIDVSLSPRTIEKSVVRIDV